MNQGESSNSSYLGTMSLPGMERGGWDLATSGMFNLLATTAT